jgi:bifunctional DNA-binding transcriptional regulator/antitoxin component of YhaV-PrlF toxin-antitoxin module
MRKKKDGDTLAERITKALEKIKKKKVTQLIDDCFFEEITEKGIPFLSRRLDLFKDMFVSTKKDVEGKEVSIPVNLRKVLNIEDEAMVERDRQIKEAEEEAKRLKTYNEFLELYLDHIEGRVDPSTRVGNRPETANEAEGQSKGGGKTGMSNYNEGDDIARTSSP